MAAKEKKKNESVDYSAQTMEAKRTALASALTGIEKTFGKGSVMKLGDDSRRDGIEVTTTGSLSLDTALGIGGIPKGRVVEVYGPESSGKTTIAMHCVAEVQKAGGIAAFVDAEHALDPVYAEAIGININDLYVSQPDNGEQALEITEALMRSGAVDLIVVDSVAALVPRAEIEGDMGDSHMGLHARLMSQALRKLVGIANKTGCTLIFINQLREKIGSYGGGETTTGGRALKFYASIRIDVRRIDFLKGANAQDVIGNRVKVKIAKNKLAPPFKVCEFDIMYGEGISREGDILEIATEMGVVVRSGAWYSYNDEKIGQGREKVKVFFEENPDICREVENKVREGLGLDLLPELPPLEKKEAVVEEVETEKGKKATKGKKAKVETLDLDEDIDDELNEEFDEEDMDFDEDFEDDFDEDDLILE